MDIKELQHHGQSVWLDYLRRDLISSGALARMVRDDGIRGVTTNPTIFEQAITGTNYYDAALEREVRLIDEPPSAIYDRLAVDDIQQAADVFRPVYDATEGRDGFVLDERGRRTLRVHLGPDVAAGLTTLRSVIGTALS